MPLCFMKDVSMNWNVLYFRAHVLCFCHPLIRKKEGDARLPWKAFRDEGAALRLVSTVWGLFPTVSGESISRLDLDGR